MMNYYVSYGLYLVTALLPFAGSLSRFTVLDRATRILCFITGISFFGELIGLFSVIRYRTNQEVYNVIGICNLVLLCLYFNFSVALFRRYHFGIVLASVSIVVWLMAILRFGSIHDQNIGYIFFEGFLTLAMTVIAMEQMVLAKSRTGMRLRNSVHFWIAWFLFMYWCLSLPHWLLFNYFKPIQEAHSWFNLALQSTTMLVNIGLALVFFRYPKMLQHVKR